MAYAIGVLSYELKDYEEAERSLRDALALGYREPDLYASPWARWRKSANCRKKPSTGTEAITSGPQLPQAQSRLAVLEAEDGNGRRAGPAGARLADMQNTPRPGAVLAQAQLARNAEQPDCAFIGPSAPPWPRMAMSPEWRYERVSCCWTTANGWLRPSAICAPPQTQTQSARS